MVYGAKPHSGHGKYGNPGDLETYISSMENPARDTWQKPDDVIRSFELSGKEVVCDVGAGPGYFSVKVAKSLELGGHVFAIDVEPKMVEVLRARLNRMEISNVTPVLGDPSDPFLPAGTCDMVMVVNTYHHFPKKVEYLQKLKKILKPGGKMVNIDFHKRDLPVGPPLAHKVAREQVVSEASQVGFKVVKSFKYLPYQYFDLFEF